MIWLAYFLLPNGAGGFVHGIPLGPVDAAALLMIAWLARVGTRLPGTPYLEVFRVAGCAGFLAYSVGLVQDAIWKGETWGVTFKHVLDGLIYGLLTAGTFGWLWPK